MIPPAQPPAAPMGCDLQSIKPTPECFGKWQGLDSEKCKACFTWGYCADIEARTATIRNATLDEIVSYHKDMIARLHKPKNGAVSIVSIRSAVIQHEKSIAKLESLRTPIMNRR